MRVNSYLRRSICAVLLLAPIGPAACVAASAEDGAQTGSAPRTETDALGLEAARRAKPEVVVTGVAADSLVTDRTDIYWRASALDASGDNFNVIVGKCSLGGGCPVGGTVLATTSALLVFSDAEEVALAAGKVIVPVGGDLMACDTGGCGGTLSTVTSSSGFITSVSSRGNELFFGVTGSAPGARSLDSCDVNHCASPHVIGVTSNAGGSAPRDPSYRDGTVAFLSKGVYVTPAQSFPAAGATLLASRDGIGGGVWNDGTDVYFSVGGQFETDDAGDSSILNGTGYVARCAVTGCGGNPKILASGESNVGGVVVAGTDVYWPVGGPFDAATGLPTGPGSIQTCSTNDGCATVRTLASGGNPSTLTVDSSHVYWGDPVAKTISRIRRH